MFLHGWSFHFLKLDEKSFLNVQEQWYPEIQSNRPEAKIILVGTKSEGENSIESKDATEYAKSINAFDYFEISSKNDTNIKELLNATLELSFQILYPNENIFYLDIELLHGNVKAMDINGKSDPFVYFKSNSKKIKSSTKNKTLSIF
jgi:hypothetical protein